MNTSLSKYSRLVFSWVFDLRENLENVKEKLIRKTFSREKKTPGLTHLFAKFYLANFFEVNGISIVFSWEIDGGDDLIRFKYEFLSLALLLI